MSVNKVLQYLKFGDPTKVLQLAANAMPNAPGAGQVIVKWIAAPINPLDLNKISGTYPAHKAKFPCIGGSEGVGVIEAVGSGVKGLSKGDKVIPTLLDKPTWANYALWDANYIRKVDDRMSIESAATLLINPATAYIMMKYYVDLKPGDYVIQNCAGSSVGHYVIQIAKALGYKTINTVYDGPRAAASLKRLKELGADYVFTDNEFAKEGKKQIKSLKVPIKLALNGTGGPSIQKISSVLARSATVLTYGGMSLKRHEFSTTAFVFNDLRAYGFAIFDFLTRPENKAKADETYRWLQDLDAKGGLSTPSLEPCAMEDYAKAMAKAVEGGHSKQLLYFDTSYMKKQ